MNRFAAAVIVCVLTLVGVKTRPLTAQAVPDSSTFLNPLLPSGPDPWVTYRDGFYYYMHSTQNSLQIWKTRDITDLKHATTKVVWRAPSSGPYSHDVWAPELHYLQGKWYIYFAADAGQNETHRMWVMETDSQDPLAGAWVLKGRLSDAGDHWAIDPSVFEDQGKLFLVWSGWESDTNGVQNIYLAEMANPWTIGSSRVKLSAPQFSWEKVGDQPSDGKVLPLPHIDVNEGPEILQHGGKIFVVYSASGCWTDYYELGMVVASSGADLLNLDSWHKVAYPVFRQSPSASVYATGHNSFFKSPDGSQDWIIYHANAAPHEGCGDTRSPRAQPFSWGADGLPLFGEPLTTAQRLSKPSGTLTEGYDHDSPVDREGSGRTGTAAAHLH